MAVDFNKIIKARERDIKEEYKARTKRCLPVAQKILEMLAAEKLPMGELADKQGEMKEDVKGRYEDFASKILVLMLESGILYSERNFLFQLMMQPFEQTKEKVIRSVERSFERAFTEKWKDELDITMGDIHEILLGIAKK